MATMLILRGNRGSFPDENGKTKSYPKGALHERAALDYAKRKGYSGQVLDVSGDSGENHDRSRSPQTIMAKETFLRSEDITAFYGFSGGGYNIYWILKSLEEKDLQRLTLIAVLGAPERPQAKFEASDYTGGKWDLVYQKDPPASASVVPRGVDPHMFGPEWLLSKTPVPTSSPATP